MNRQQLIDILLAPYQQPSSTVLSSPNQERDGGELSSSITKQKGVNYAGK